MITINTLGIAGQTRKEKNRWEGGGGRWDEEKPVEKKPVESERKLGEAMVKHDIMAHVPYVSTLQSSVAM